MGTIEDYNGETQVDIIQTYIVYTWKQSTQRDVKNASYSPTITWTLHKQEINTNNIQSHPSTSLLLILGSLRNYPFPFTLFLHIFKLGGWDNSYSL